MKIRIKRGLDLPFPKSKPVQTTLSKPKRLALNLDPFDAIRFKLHVKVGDHVKLGEPIAENKAIAGQMFLSPASGTVVELKRGLKRRLLDVVIEVDEKEELYQHEPPKEGKEELLEFFLRAGVFPHIRLRPFDLVADPTHLPRAIFVRAVESRPLSQEIVVEQENERYFAKGLEALGQIAAVHLVYREKSSCPAFVKAEGVEKHTVMGPHPAGNSSVHIHHILPIKSAHDYTWTIDTVGVVTIGKLLLDHTYFVDRTIQLEGPGVSQSAIFKARMGYPIADLVAGRKEEGLLCMLSGDPLSGSHVDESDYLGFYDSSVSLLPVSTKRQPLHFFRLGANKFTATRTYLSAFLPKGKGFDFTTNQHGEERAFIDPALYDKVMPMRIPTVQLVKALMAQDFELAEVLGVYEVAPEDFLLPSFICPSKIEMADIVKQGLSLFANEMGH